MKATSKQTVEITLTLNLDEARRVMGMTQNYWGEELGEDPADEDPGDARVREAIFTALKTEVDKVFAVEVVKARKAGP